jgi:itaconyl-CoA hydratase
MTAFVAYAKVGDRRYREDLGLDFEQFAPGQRFRHRPGITVSQQDNKDAALDTLNAAMLHYDAAYAARTEWGRNLFVSTLTLALVTGMTSKTFGKRARGLGFDSIVMTRPVYGGDTLYAESEITATEYAADAPGAGPDQGIIRVATTGLNERGESVCALSSALLVWRTGRDPLASGGAGRTAVAAEARFASHRRADDGAWIEQVGLDWEDLEPGETFEHRPGKTLTIDESVRHTLRSLEQTPGLTDHHANRQLHGGRLALADTYVLGALTALTTKSLGRVVANLEWTDVRFATPAFDGDTLYAETTILDKRPSRGRPSQGIVRVATRGVTQDRALVCSYARTLLVYRRGQGPYADAGY